MLGKILTNRYKILGKLGEGGMGIVYLAEDMKLTRKVAIKMMSTSCDDKERFLREVNIISMLNNPYIIAVHDVDFYNGRPFIVMEYVKGRTLKEVLKEGLPSTSKVLEYLLGICHGLEYMHNEGVIHRDIKPSNIMITELGNIKIMDFGISKHVEMLTLTLADQMIGTPVYMSPELAIGGEVDHRSDIYSLGIMWYEMLTGAPPFIVGDIIYQHRNTPPKPISEKRPDIIPQHEQAVMKALSKQPSKRYQTVTELKAEIQQIQLEELKQTLGGKKDLSKGIKPKLFDIAGKYRTLTGQVGKPKVIQGKTVSMPVSSTPFWENLPIQKIIIVLSIIVGMFLGTALFLNFYSTSGVKLYISSKPENATIGIEGGDKLGETPLIITKNITVDKVYRLYAEKEGYKREVKEVIPKKGELPIHFELKELAYGKLSINSDPIAEVIIDGKFQGVTPLLNQELEIGEHTIILSNKEKKLEKTYNIVIEKDKLKEINEFFDGTLTITGTNGIELVEIGEDGKEKSLGIIKDSEKIKLTAGKHRFRAKKEGFQSKDFTVTIKGGENIDKEITLTPVEIIEKKKEPPKESVEISKKEVLEKPDKKGGTGDVFIKSTPPAQIIIDGRDQGSYTPKQITLPVGSHTLRLTRPGCRAEERFFQIKKGETTKLKIELDCE